jgi:hypothetical protein
MKRGHSKKLRLSSETLLRLESSQLSRVAGGWDDTNTLCNTCQISACQHSSCPSCNSC